jgi:hypothetical protein
MTLTTLSRGSAGFVITGMNFAPAPSHLPNVTVNSATVDGAAR